MSETERPVRPRQDNGNPAPPEHGFGGDIVMGVRFFSRLPTGDRPFEKPNLSRIAVGLPFCSLVIGLLPVLLMMLATWAGLPAYFAVAMGVAAMAIATGAMPEDAIADAADGLFGGSSIERRLEIMKDSRHGTYGVTALGLYLVLRVVGLGSVAAVNPLAAGGIWLASTILARSGSLWLSLDLPNAREGGASASVGRVSRPAFLIGAGFAILLSFVLAAPFTSVLAMIFALAATAAVAIGWSWWCRRLVGGQTGDLIGALHVLIELAVLTVLLIFT